MSGLSGNKLNQLVLNWPRGTVCTTGWLRKLGFSRQLIERYKKSRWLTSIGWGAYKLTNDPVSWPGAVYAIQEQLHLQVHPGGKTALQLKGLAHFVPAELKEIFLFGTRPQKLPTWFKIYDWAVDVSYSLTNLFDKGLGLSQHDFGSFSIKVSAAERAVMEMLYLVPQKQTLNESSLIMEHLVGLRPTVVQELLENCNSIKTKRLFMFLAEKHDHQWMKNLDLSRVNLGPGKITIVSGGVYDSKYKIVVPRISG